jgi:hypothetical protein
MDPVIAAPLPALTELVAREFSGIPVSGGAAWPGAHRAWRRFNPCPCIAPFWRFWQLDTRVDTPVSIKHRQGLWEGKHAYIIQFD